MHRVKGMTPTHPKMGKTVWLPLCTLCALLLCAGASAQRMPFQVISSTRLVTLVGSSGTLVNTPTMRAATVVPGRTPVFVASSDVSAIKDGAPKLTLPLAPGLSVPVTIRSDFPGQQLQQATTKAAGGGDSGLTIGAFKMWVGDVDGYEGPYSSAVLGLDGNTTFGYVRYVDITKGTVRAFMIEPATVRTSSGGLTKLATVSKITEVKEIAQQRRKALPPRDAAAGIAASEAGAIAAAGPWQQASFIMPVSGNGSAIPLGVVEPLIPNPMSPEAQAAAAAQLATTAAVVAAPEGSDLSAQQPPLVDAMQAASATPATAASGDAAAVDAAATPLAEGGGRRKLQQSSAVQDLLVLYTAAAASYAGGPNTLQQWISQNVAMTTKAYVDSGISLQLRLTSVQQVSYSESGKTAGQVLDDLGAGRVPNAATLRSQTRADLVTMFTTAPGCGIGYLSHNNPNLRFSLVQNDCMKPGYTLAHELGHNQGCDHNVQDRNSFMYGPYALGWLRCDLGNNNFKTIMSYWCGANRLSWVPELGLFARPEGRYNNIPTGDASNGHCARAIRETAATIAATQSGLALPANLLPNNYCLNGGGCLSSPDGRFRLCMQTDANVVLYQGSTAIWASKTQNRSTAGPFRLCAQLDGNLVAVDSRNSAFWASNTSGRGPVNAVVQNDGNFVLYTTAGQAIWASNTCCR